MAVHASSLMVPVALGRDVADAAEPGERAGEGARGDRATHSSGALALGLESGSVAWRVQGERHVDRGLDGHAAAVVSVVLGRIGLQRLAVGGHRALLST